MKASPSRPADASRDREKMSFLFCRWGVDGLVADGSQALTAAAVAEMAAIRQSDAAPAELIVDVDAAEIAAAAVAMTLDAAPD